VTLLPPPLTDPAEHGVSVVNVNDVFDGIDTTSNSRLSLARYNAVTVPPPVVNPTVAVSETSIKYSVDETTSLIVCVALSTAPVMPSTVEAPLNVTESSTTA
jgi:hypothetical protein